VLGGRIRPRFGPPLCPFRGCSSRLEETTGGEGSLAEGRKLGQRRGGFGGGENVENSPAHFILVRERIHSFYTFSRVAKFCNSELSDL
jgi:hypothetical protein